MKLFLIGGQANSGKNSCALAIKEYYNQKHQKTLVTEFSKYIKMYAKEMIHWDGKQETKPREFLQDMGEHIRKTYGEDFFINRMKEDIEIYKSYFDVIVICDCRLIQEIEAMREYYLDVVTIHMENPLGNTLSPKEKAHRTELELEDYYDFDYNMEYVSLEELKKEVKEMLDSL